MRNHIAFPESFFIRAHRNACSKSINSYVGTCAESHPDDRVGRTGRGAVRCHNTQALGQHLEKKVCCNEYAENKTDFHSQNMPMWLT